MFSSEDFVPIPYSFSKKGPNTNVFPAASLYIDECFDLRGVKFQLLQTSEFKVGDFRLLGSFKFFESFRMLS